MGPKKKEKKKGKKKAEKEPKITKTEYLNKIAENNAILAKARKEIEGIEDVYFSTEKKFEETQEDMADIIKYLLHEIQDNEEEIAVFDEKINSYKMEVKKNDKYYESIFAELENKYEEKFTQLQHQIQTTNAKLFASEETRKQREAYLKQKDLACLKLQLMRMRHEEEIYNAEKLAITKQDTLQKNMGLHLTKLATDFRQATDTAIGETTNKLIKDNITLGNTLTCMQQIIGQERDSYLRVHAIEKNCRYNAELLNDEYCYTVKKFDKKIQEVEALLRSQEELNERITACQRLFKDNRRLQRTIAERECILRERTQDINDLLRVFEENGEVSNSVKKVFNAMRKSVLKLAFSLFEAAKKTKEGIVVENLTRLEEKDDEAYVEVDKEEMEENLKEFKYKIRSGVFEEIFEKLTTTLQQEGETQLISPTSDSYLTSGFNGSVSSDANRSSDLYIKKMDGGENSKVYNCEQP